MFDLKRKATRTPMSSTSSVTSHRQNLSGAAVKPDHHHKSPGSFSHANNYSSRFKASSSTNSQSNTRGVTKLPNTEPLHASCQKDIYNDAASRKSSFKLNTPSKAPSKAPKPQCDSVSTGNSDNCSRAGTANRTSSRTREREPLKNLGLIGIAAAAWLAYEIFQRQYDSDGTRPWDLWGASEPIDPMVRPDPEGRGNGILTNPQSSMQQP